MNLSIYIDDEIFVYEVVPKLLQKRIIDTLNNKVKNKQTIKIDSYLKDYYKTNLSSILKDIKKYINIKKFGKNHYIISIDDKILRFIDFGNLKVSGLHIIDSSMKFIQNNLTRIYNIYRKGGLIYVN